MAAPGDERNVPKLRPSWVGDQPASDPTPVAAPASEEVPLRPDAMRTSRAGTLWYWGGMSVAVLVIVVLSAMLIVPRLPWPDSNNRPASSSGSADPLAWVPNTTSMIGPSLDRQAEMLLAGDEQGWLAPLDPENADLMKIYINQFETLRLLGVVGFKLVVDQLELFQLTPGAAEVTLDVFFGFCAQTSLCPEADDRPVNGLLPTEGYTATLTWTRQPDRRYLISRFVLVEEHKAAVAEGRKDLLGKYPTNSFPPWLTDDLTFASGEKVVVAAPAALAGDLDRVVAMADDAAEQVARFARWTQPSRYVIYLAGPSEFLRWYGPEERADVSGFAARVGKTASPVVINYRDVPADRLGHVLRHELAHVNTLLGAPYPGYHDALIEGIAEYAAFDGQPIAGYERLDALRRFLRAGWDGDIDRLFRDSADPLHRSAVYAIGLLTWRCLAERYGEEAMFVFATDTLQVGFRPEEVSVEVFGAEWTDIKRACAQYVRDVT